MFAGWLPVYEVHQAETDAFYLYVSTYNAKLILVSLQFKQIIESAKNRKK